MTPNPQDSAVALKPCPFCGSNDIKAKHGKTLMLDCQGCGVVLINYKDGVQRDVHEVWNRRASIPHPGWRPIATAPKRGEWILLHGSTTRTRAGMLVARWDGRDWESADDGYGAYITPSHWMPLPLPPAPNQSQGENHVG